jgi:uncharacterized protein (DUF362 family)
MDRRMFFKRTLGASAAMGTLIATGSYRELFAYTESPLPYDLVAVKGGMPDAMFDLGIEALGGIGAFVKKGQKVVVKPNIGWDVTPERAGCTNPKLVSRIIEHCFKAGAKEVYVVDHTCDDWKKSYSTSGIEKAAKDAGAKVVPGHAESYYQAVDVPSGAVLKKAKEHEVILGADVFINVPILKHHSGTTVTVSMKNLMGNVWDREFWHRNDLHQCIADFATYRKPTLNVVDAYHAMKTNGPRGVSTEDVVTMKMLLVSTDIVASDAAATKLLGVDPEDIRHITIAAGMGAGRKDLDKLNIKRITV